jgi:hypothetical protein
LARLFENASKQMNNEEDDVQILTEHLRPVTIPGVDTAGHVHIPSQNYLTITQPQNITAILRYHIVPYSHTISFSFIENVILKLELILQNSHFLFPIMLSVGSETLSCFDSLLLPQ